MAPRLLLTDVDVGDILGLDDGLGLALLLGVWDILYPALGGGVDVLRTDVVVV